MKHIKNLIGTLFKIFVSCLFLYFVIKRIEFHSLAAIFRHSAKTPLIIIFFLNYILTVFLALRWRTVLTAFRITPEAAGDSVPYENPGFLHIWKLTLIGLFFNVFLPTGAGGDAIKIYYLTRNEKEKLKLAVSVLFDRFVGSCSVILMGLAAVILYWNRLPSKAVIAILSIFVLVVAGWLLIFWNELAILIGKIIPKGIKEKLRTFYDYVRHYGFNVKIIVTATVISFLLQAISIYMQYFAAFRCRGCLLCFYL